MKNLFQFAVLFVATTLSAQQKDYAFQAVNFTQVRLTDQFWLPRLKINHTVTIPASFERCENTGRVIDELGQHVTTRPAPFTAIPYYALANRGKGEMQVWFPTRVKDIDLLTTKTKTNINTK